MTRINTAEKIQHYTPPV